MFEPITGKGMLVATDVVAKANMFKWNGPEWLGTTYGDQIVYTYFIPGLKRAAPNARMAIAAPDSNGVWVSRTISPDMPRMSHVTSRDAGDTQPRLRYLDPDLYQYWRDADNPATEEWLWFIPPSNRAWRFASGARALMFSQPAADGRWQVFSYQLDSKVIKQMTFDDGQKDNVRTVPWMWRAPEFGNNFIIATVADETELRIYRKIGTEWTAVHRARVPAGRTLGSPEWFVYNNRSYVLMSGFVNGNGYPTEIWVSSIDPARPLLRKVTVDAPARVRNDPEVFITDLGPRIYYNRYDPSVNPDNPLCNECSEGVYMADPGLAAALRPGLVQRKAR